MRVLVVSEDVNLVKLLEDTLARSGYSVDVTGGVAEGQDFDESISYHVILIDAGLPYQELTRFCRNLRRTGSTIPVLILAEKQAETKTVALLDAGADDFLEKPVKPDLLLASLRAMERRGRRDRSLLIRAEDLVIDTAEMVARLGERELRLATKEYALLLELVRQSGRTVNRRLLEQRVWGISLDSTSNTLDVHISRLRSKLRGSNSQIKTIWKVGYRMEIT